MDECVFCQIISRDCAGSIFYEDDLVAGFLTIGPVTKGHAMVVPKEHVPYLSDLDEETGRHLFTVTQRTAEAIRRSGLVCEGINLFLADGEAAFQEVFHLHMHVFPRYKGDTFRLEADWSQKPPRSELDEVAMCIRESYEKIWR
jgi:histidine triad (HIT) family protein